MAPSFCDKIIIYQLEGACILGMTEEERRSPQKVQIDLEIYTDTSAAGKSDRLELTLDYQKISERVLEHLQDSSFHLIEALAESVAKMILKEFSVKELVVRLFKPNALAKAKTVAVEIHRSR